MSLQLVGGGEPQITSKEIGLEIVDAFWLIEVREMINYWQLRRGSTLNTFSSSNMLHHPGCLGWSVVIDILPPLLSQL